MSMPVQPILQGPPAEVLFKDPTCGLVTTVANVLPIVIQKTSTALNYSADTLVPKSVTSLKDTSCGKNARCTRSIESSGASLQKGSRSAAKCLDSAAKADITKFILGPYKE